MYHVIHCEQHTEREEHVRSLEKTLGYPIRLFKGVCPTQREYELSPLRPRFTTRGHMGCYLSHLTLIESLLGSTDKYSVIFEDDVTFDSGLHDKILEIASKVEFDIILLGHFIIGSEFNRGEHVRDNIYKIDPRRVCYGTHALLINNKSLQKIYDLIKTPHHHIDNMYANFIKSGRLLGYLICDPLCTQVSHFKSHTSDMLPENKI